MTRRVRRCLFATTALLLLGNTADGQQSPEFPLRGEISAKPAGGVMLRKDPPDVAPLRYELGQPVCAVGNGGEFFASEAAYIANGEIWYRVLVTKLGAPVRDTCTRVPAEGWIAAKLRNRSVVTVTERGVQMPNPDEVSSETENPNAGTTTQPAVAEPANDVLDLSDVLLLLMGTMLALAVIAIKRVGEIAPGRWITGMWWFEFAVVMIVNITITLVFFDRLYQNESGGIFLILGVLKEAEAGFALFGFLLTILLMKFMSFVRS